MFIEKKKVEKLLKERNLCSSEQFWIRSSKRRWRKNAYKSCISAIFDHYGIPDDRGTNEDKLIPFLNDKDAKSVEIGPKRRHVDYSMAESEDEGDIHDVSMDTVMSLDEPEEMLALKRQVIQLRIELKGLFEWFYILLSFE